MSIEMLQPLQVTPRNKRLGWFNKPTLPGAKLLLKSLDLLERNTGCDIMRVLLKNVPQSLRNKRQFINE
jgi:hypothetical protein